jgi:flagellar motor protein MotB
VVLSVAVAAAALTGAAAAGGLVLSDRGPDPAVLASLDEVQASQRQQADRLGDIDAKLGQPQATLDTVTAALGGDTALLVRADKDQVVVAFPAGVFRSLARLSDSGTAALADLGRRLGPLADDVSITVVGHTEDSPVSRSSGYSTNAELGLARAVAAAEQLSTASGLPLSTFTLSSAGEANPPFPNTSQESRAQNRTVTVVLRPR